MATTRLIKFIHSIVYACLCFQFDQTGIEQVHFITTNASQQKEEGAQSCPLAQMWFRSDH
jgi:hypothetical protein